MKTSFFQFLFNNYSFLPFSLIHQAQTEWMAWPSHWVISLTSYKEADLSYHQNTFTHRTIVQASIMCRYHNWMQSAEILQLTASEPLSLEQEYKMQADWMNDTESKREVIIVYPHQSGIW